MIDKLNEQREALVRSHMDVEMQGDTDAIIATFSRPRYDIIATNTVFDGAERVRLRIEQLIAAMPGCSIVATAIHHAAEAVIVETRTTGFHTATLFGISPTGRPYDIRGVAIFRFNGLELIEEAVYYDRQTIIEQLVTRGEDRAMRQLA